MCVCETHTMSVPFNLMDAIRTSKHPFFLSLSLSSVLIDEYFYWLTLQVSFAMIDLKERLFWFCKNKKTSEKIVQKFFESTFASFLASISYQMIFDFELIE